MSLNRWFGLDDDDGNRRAGALDDAVGGGVAARPSAWLPPRKAFGSSEMCAPLQQCGGPESIAQAPQGFGFEAMGWWAAPRAKGRFRTCPGGWSMAEGVEPKAGPFTGASDMTLGFCKNKIASGACASIGRESQIQKQIPDWIFYGCVPFSLP